MRWYSISVCLWQLQQSLHGLKVLAFGVLRWILYLRQLLQTSPSQHHQGKAVTASLCIVRFPTSRTAHHTKCQSHRKACEHNRLGFPSAGLSAWDTWVVPYTSLGIRDLSCWQSRSLLKPSWHTSECRLTNQTLPLPWAFVWRDLKILVFTCFTDL